MSPPSAYLLATSSTVRCDSAWIPTRTVVSSFISVLPKHHSLLLDGEQYPCDETVYVSGDESSTLTCAVDSKPEAKFTWSSTSGVVGSKTGDTTCTQREDKVYHCVNTLSLSLPKADIPLVGVKVTCQVDAVGNRTDLCITIGEFGAIQASRNGVFSWKFDTHSPGPRNANNIEPYIFVKAFFSGKSDTLPPFKYCVTLHFSSLFPSRASSSRYDCYDLIL